MSKVFFISAVVFLSAVSVFSQFTSDADDLKSLLNEFLAGASRNDAAIHDRFWADDLVYTRSSGVRIGKEELMNGVRSAPKQTAAEPATIYTADDIRIQKYGNTAVVAFRLISTTKAANGQKTVSYNLNTGTFVKRNNTWQVVAWQSTTVPTGTSTLAEQRPQTVPVETVKAADTSSASETSSAPSSRKYMKGERGGCYYFNSSGKKVYVNKSFCG